MTKFIILTKGRTGSNMITTALNQHPRIYCRGEVFKLKWADKTERELQKTFEAKINSRFQARGCKVLYRHLENEKLLKYIEDNDDIKIIHLIRDNKPKMYVSNEIAGRTKFVAKEEDDLVKQEDKPIEVDVKDMEEWINEAEDQDVRHGLMFSDRVKLIRYRDLTDKWDMAVGYLLSFLNTDLQDVEPETLKQNSEPLSFLIKNYDEVKSHFKDSKWSKYLNG